LLFDIRPKERRIDLYDFEKELEELKKGLEKTPITFLIGVEGPVRPRFSKLP
jgi:hypothetical protein